MAWLSMMLGIPPTFLLHHACCLFPESFHGPNWLLQLSPSPLDFQPAGRKKGEKNILPLSKDTSKKLYILLPLISCCPEFCHIAILKLQERLEIFFSLEPMGPTKQKSHYFTNKGEGILEDNVLSPPSAGHWILGANVTESMSLVVFFSRFELELILPSVSRCFYPSHLFQLLEALLTKPNLTQLSFRPRLLHKCLSGGKKRKGKERKIILIEKQTEKNDLLDLCWQLSGKISKLKILCLSYTQNNVLAITEGAFSPPHPTPNSGKRKYYQNKTIRRAGNTWNSAGRQTLSPNSPKTRNVWFLSDHTRFLLMWSGSAASSKYTHGPALHKHKWEWACLGANIFYVRIV